ncbi:LPS-induced tumor necrosis factor alpha factor [Fusarium albosuccineum]|uniref:LPS-induced tumor necrosis factor alpha factor n=1 Tax=Fusarium albosuccineum TaxID=1237068 RepID=A0A8H4PFH3_9HYPO|nr:LPS-induced tumor necrosis factor alpha factor [Fusarium albosuccineum]
MSSTTETVQTTGVAPPKSMPQNMIQAEDKLMPVAPAPAYVATAPSPQPGLKIEALPDVERVTPLHMLGESPAWIDCPFCQRRTMTKVNTEGSGTQVVMSILCCLICVCLVCLPAAAGWFEHTHHYCSNCNARVVTRPYDGPIQVFGPQIRTDVPTSYGNPTQAPPAQAPPAQAAPAPQKSS